MKSIVFLFVIVIVGAYGAYTGARSQSSEWDSRIVGGSEVGENAAPYHATLRNPNNTYFCGGAIISTRTILTSAQCLFGRKAETTMAYIGTNTLSYGGSRFQGYIIRSHPNYDQFTHKYDIGLLIVDRVMELSASVAYLKPSSAIVKPDSTVSLTGFGATTNPGEYSDNLRIINLKTISEADCQANSGGPTGTIDESNVCTFTKTGEGACRGDVGSPLVDETGIVGVYIWGEPCAVGRPDVYTSVSIFYGWIEKNQVGTS